MSLIREFDGYSNWRAKLSQGLARLSGWLSDNDLGDAQSDLRLKQLLERLRDDKLIVAFVAEFSRGKSELINAMFFAEYGSRILPSSAGRTTMCPTEICYDKANPIAIELLPIETRARQGNVSEFKRYPDEWRRFPLDTSSAEAMAIALKHVGDSRRVSIDTARDFGFAIDESADGNGDGLAPNADGSVAIPCWRHAIINFPHPLLEQGLVILDTPGLNAIGAEPELTLSLLPSAHAILFILAADTGVTQSDLTIWRDHVAVAHAHKGRMVVLNKIDGLWDGLRPQAEIDAEIWRQVNASAETLGLTTDQVFPVSAQKGLVAKINRDHALLSRSRLPQLEHALTRELLSSKQEIVRDSILLEAHDLCGRARARLQTRLVNVCEQRNELGDLRGKNQSVIEYMMSQVRREKDAFEKGLQQYYAVRSVFSQLTNELFVHLGMGTLRKDSRGTREAMDKAAFSKGLRDEMSGYFHTVRAHLATAANDIGEIMQMLKAMYQRFNSEHGLTLDPPLEFSLLRHEKKIDRLEEQFKNHFNTLLNILTREKRVITQQFFETVAVEIRKIFQSANRDVEHWLGAVMAPLETQVREVQIQLKRRLESVKRIHQATDTLEERISELAQMEETLRAQLEGLQQVRAGLDCALEDTSMERAAA